MRRCLNCMKEYAEEYEDKCPYCGYVHGVTREADMGLMPGTILHSRYIVGTVIRVRDVDLCYRGWDAIFDRQVRIQEYFPRYCAARAGNPQMTIYESRQERFQEGLRTFIHESRELIRAYREPDVITYYACFEENRTAYAIMEARELQTLRDSLTEGRLDEKEALTLLGQAWEAVEKCHELGVSHGMLDPEAFWRTGDGRLILKDFGSWRYVCGEPGIVNYGNPGPETDVYGLAKLFCQLVTGREIFEGDKLEQELLMSQTGLSRNVMTAMKHALSHETKSMSRFQEEWNGQVTREAEESFSRNRDRRRDLRKPLGIPKWVFALSGAVILAVVVVIVLLMTGVIGVQMHSSSAELPVNMVRMPNVVNEDADEAEKILEDEGLGMSKDRMDYSEEIPENLILYQEVQANSLIAQGTEVMVYISKGQEKAVFPSVVGLMREEAVEKLEKAGFWNVVIEESDEPGLYDSVLDVSEKQSDNVALSTEILLTICVNEGNQEGDESVQVEVPELIAQSREKVEIALEEIGLKVNWVEENSDEPEGTILAQTPAAGELVDRDTYVTVTVSIGQEKIYMVSVELDTREEAVAKIKALGLTTGSITEVYSDSVASGKVISQSVANGAEVKKGDSVNLVISKGKDPAKQTKAAQTQPVTTQAPETTAAPTTVAPETTAAPETTTVSETTEVSEASPEATTASEPIVTPKTAAALVETISPLTTEASEATAASTAGESPKSVDGPASQDEPAAE